MVEDLLPQEGDVPFGRRALSRVLPDVLPEFFCFSLVMPSVNVLRGSPVGRAPFFYFCSPPLLRPPLVNDRLFKIFSLSGFCPPFSFSVGILSLNDKLFGSGYFRYCRLFPSVPVSVRGLNPGITPRLQPLNRLPGESSNSSPLLKVLRGL